MLAAMVRSAARTLPTGVLASILSVLAAACSAAPTPLTSTPATPPITSTAPASAAPAPLAPLVLSTLITRPFNLATQMLSLRGLARSASGALVTDGDAATLILLDSATGHVRWEVPVTEEGKGYIHASGVGFAGEDLVFGGEFASQLAVSSKPTLSAAGESAFILRFDASGKLLTSAAVTGEGVSMPGLAVDASGAALLGGAFNRDVKLGSVTLPGTGKGNGISGNLFIARLAAGGATAWATEIRGNAYIDHVIDGGVGRVLIEGDFFGTFALAGETFTGTDTEHR